MHMTTCNNKKLPIEFLKEMEDLLGPSYNDFLESYKNSKTSAIRINELKISKNDFEELDLFGIDYERDKVTWSEESYYIGPEQSPGRNPLHDAGAYYIQEPSAISVVGQTDIRSGDKVLDMCAAPGGKSTYIASKLGQSGLLVSNEINRQRITSLGDNLERFGARNTVIINEDSKNLLTFFKGFFDKIFIDAPCSGQGMFRKDDYAIEDWSQAKVMECTNIQKTLIRDGYQMLKEGGQLIYSTCTFTRRENEDIIEDFLNEHEGASLISMSRIWPHIDRGEGHFCARISKTVKGDNDEDSYQFNTNSLKKSRKLKPKKILMSENLPKEFTEFIHKNLKGFMDEDFKSYEDNIVVNRDMIYLSCINPNKLNGLRVLRNGILLGYLKKNRFEPSHSLAMALKRSDVKNSVNYAHDSEEICKYIEGQSIQTGQSRGWVLVCVEGCSVGWGKESGGVLKNKYPKGLRRVIKR